jgi:hypothetical protein
LSSIIYTYLLWKVLVFCISYLGTLCKAFLTNITDVGALSRVLPHVNLQGFVLRELPVAHGAREPFQAHVALQVTLQVALHLFLSQNFKLFKNFFSMLGIGIGRILMFLGNPDPDPLVRDMDQDPSLFS